MLSSRSSSMATQPIPPSLMAILRLGRRDGVAGPQPLGAGDERQLAEQRGAELQGVHAGPGRGRGQARAADVEGDDGVGLDDGLHDRVPVVPVPQRGQPDLVRPLGEGHRGEAPGGVAADLGHGEGGVGQVGDAERDDAIGMRASTTPRRASRSRPCTQARPRSRILGVEEDATTEPGDHGREVHRGPDPVDVHVANAGIDVVATRSHLVEAERFEAVGLRAPAGHRVHPHLRVALALELPHLVALRRLDDAGRAVGQRGGQPVLERVGRLDDVVVDRDHGVAHLPGLGLGEEEIVVRHEPEYARRGRAVPRRRCPRLRPVRGWILGRDG